MIYESNHNQKKHGTNSHKLLALFIVLGLIVLFVLLIPASFKAEQTSFIVRPGTRFFCPVRGFPFQSDCHWADRELTMSWSWIPWGYFITSPESNGEKTVIASIQGGWLREPSSQEFTVTVDGLEPQVEWEFPLGSLVPAEVKTLRFKTDEPCSLETQGGLGVSLKDTPGNRWDEIHVLQTNTESIEGEVFFYDKAGNQTRVEAQWRRDLSIPTIKISGYEKNNRVTNSGALRLKVIDEDKTSDVTIAFNDKVVWEGQVTTGIENPIRLPHLPDGLFELEIQAEDEAGNDSFLRFSGTLDTQEQFGVQSLTYGALGNDVSILQKKLKKVGYLKGDFQDGFFDEKTRRAVLALEEDWELKSDGIADTQVYNRLGPRIFINKSLFELVIETSDKEVRTFPIAYGKAYNPTIAGRYYVKEMVVDPPWFPPDSDWAKDAEPVAPGPDNPLGPRWIGLDRGAYGIHGTNAPWSIGSQASRGCIRMKSHDVIQVFDYTEVGAPVYIFDGDEEDRNLSRLWPEGKPRYSW